MTYRVLVVVTVTALAACAQSPLYDTGQVIGGTRGEVPRDGNGEPMLASIRPMPVTAMPVPQPAPVAPR